MMMMMMIVVTTFVFIFPFLRATVKAVSLVLHVPLFFPFAVLYSYGTNKDR